MRRRTTGPLPASIRMRHPLVAAIAVASSLLAAAGVAAPARAAGTTYARVRTVAASADWVVYRQQTGSAYDLTFPGGRLYFVGTKGGRHALPGFDPERTQTLQGSTLVEADPSAVVADRTRTEQVRWRDLRTGASGTAVLPASDDLVGAAPGGWIATRTDDRGTRLVRYRTDGRTTDLGAPLPGDAPVQASIGPAGVVVAARNTDSGRFDALSDSSGLIRYSAFRTPGRWRTVHSAGAGVDTTCAPPSSTHVACVVDATGTRSGTVLLPLGAGSSRWLGAHPSACAVVTFLTVGSTAVGKASSTQPHCVRGRLTQLDAKGRLTTPKRDWGPHAGYLVGGLGGLLLDSADQRRIVRLSSVTGAARTVVTAR